MQPERRIEKWLRAFAKKRREQAGEPMQLRESTRHRLQREVARLSEEKSRGGFFSGLFFGPRPRLVFAACFTALALGGWFLWRQSTATEPATLSMNKESYQEIASAPAAPAAPPPAVMSPVVVVSEDKKAAGEKQPPIAAAPQPTQPTIVAANRSLEIPATDMPKERDRTESVDQKKQLTVTTATAATNLSLAFKNEAASSLANSDGLAKDASAGLPATLAPQSTNFIAGTIYSDSNGQTLKSMSTLQSASTIQTTNTALFDLAKATGAVAVSQVFNRQEISSTRRAAVTTRTPSPVLTSFRVEQSGNNLKIFDRDGSVYTGAVQIAQQEPSADYSFAAAKNQPVGAARAAKSAAPAAQNYFFRVAGTNQNLKANVVFSGNFVPFTNSSQPAAGARSIGGFGGGGGAGGGFDQTITQPVQAILSNSQINGNLVIGNQKAVEVIATPAK